MTLLAVVNPNLFSLVLIGLIIIAVGVVLRYLHQPYVVAYILAGILLGKHGFEILTNEEIIQTLGEFGLILLLFFIGMEISLPNLLKNWKTPTIGVLIQVAGSLFIITLIGSLLGWSLSRIVFIGFAISLSSSAVVIKLLQDNQESQTDIGQSVISILIMQDILIVPMLITINYLGGNSPSIFDVILQITGGIFLIGGIVWISRKKEFSLPFSQYIEHDHELQVFIAFIMCFGFAAITGFFGLSAALGAFVAGLVVHAARSTEWFHDSLHSFRIIFVAIFFISIGMLIDLHFLYENWQIVSFLLIAVYLTNHFLNATILYYLGRNWKKALYGGALLAQIGELSFVLTSSAYSGKIINDFAYQLTIIIISLTLLISPLWILGTKSLVKYQRSN